MSPNFSLLKTYPNPPKRIFHKERSNTREQAAARFIKIFEEDIDQKKIQYLYNTYTKRFHECRDLEVQMTSIECNRSDVVVVMCTKW